MGSSVAPQPIVAGPTRTTRAAPPGLGAVGFSRAKVTPFDDALSKLSDAAQVLFCQAVDEIIRDLQKAVSTYRIPASTKCTQFYAWLDNQAVTTIGKYLDGYQTMLTELGLGGLPDNTGAQLTRLRDAIVAVLRATFDPVCQNPGTPDLTKALIQKRLKALQGMLCMAQAGGTAGAGTFPKVVRDPVSGAMTVVTADGNKIKLNLDNSADNSNNIANDGGSGGGGSGGGGLDPNTLAALLLMRSPGLTDDAPTDTPVPSYFPVGMDTTLPPADSTTAATGYLDIDPSLLYSSEPTAPPVPTLLGLGPIGLFMVAVLLIGIGILVWQLSKTSPAAPASAPAPVAMPPYYGGGAPDVGMPPGSQMMY